MADAIIQGMHGCSREDSWVLPEDPRVREKLEWFRDRKLGLMMHFGIYTQLGLCESWPLSDGDADWSRTEIDWVSDGRLFREQYRSLNRSFNPVRFQPEKWADAAARNGFQYFLFTTKHHDGFCFLTRSIPTINPPGRTAPSASTGTRISSGRPSMPSGPGDWASQPTSPSRTGTAHGTGRRAWSTR